LVEFNEAADRIWLEVFLHEYKKKYVGVDTPELHRLILRETTDAITSIKARFIHSRTRATVTISLDDIFKKMTDYIVLLPENVRCFP